jgi:hypothetical protein
VFSGLPGLFSAQGVAAEVLRGGGEGKVDLDRLL